MDIAPSRRSNIIFVAENEGVKDLIISNKRYFIDLASAEEVIIRKARKGLIIASFPLS